MDRSVSRREALLPTEEGGGRWSAGLMACASLCDRSADRMRKGACEGDWRKAVGAARLLRRMAEDCRPRRPGGPAEKEGESRRLLSEGRPSDMPRVCR